MGDEVYGLIDGYRDGAAAELIAVEARDVTPKPTTIDHVHAATLPQAGLTSWQAMFVHGAAGAVGTVSFVREPSGAQLAEIAALVDRGAITPRLGAVYSLADARAAFTAKDRGGIPGRVVLTP